MTTHVVSLRPLILETGREAGERPEAIARHGRHDLGFARDRCAHARAAAARALP